MQRCSLFRMPLLFLKILCEMEKYLIVRKINKNDVNIQKKMYDIKKWEYERISDYAYKNRIQINKFF